MAASCPSNKEAAVTILTFCWVEKLIIKAFFQINNSCDCDLLLDIIEMSAHFTLLFF
jgi:hypothetical protein